MIENILDNAKKKVDTAEVYFAETLSNSILFESGILKNIERKSISGAGLRVIHEGRLGFSSTTDPTRIEEMIENACANSRYGKEVRFAFPGSSEIQQVATFDPAVESYMPDEAVEEGKRAVNALRGTCPKGLTDVIISSNTTKVRIANTSGLDISQRSTVFSHVIYTTIVEGDSILWIEEGGEYGALKIRTEEYIEKISDLVRKSETKAPKVSGSMPVIFTARELPSLLKSIELGVDGKRLVKGDSPLIGREGENVLGSITLTDDPLIDGAPGSRAFDGEGVPSQRNVLFKDGVFQTFLFDLGTASDACCVPLAQRAGYCSTASAVRSMLSCPVVSASNLVMSTGDSNLEKMISEIDEGIIVYGVLGGGQSNLIAGDFAHNIRLGFLIQKGEIAGRLVDTMVSGNVYSAFGSISALSSETHQIGSMFLPDAMFSELSISSR